MCFELWCRQTTWRLQVTHIKQLDYIPQRQHNYFEPHSHFFMLTWITNSALLNRHRHGAQALYGLHGSAIVMVYSYKQHRYKQPLESVYGAPPLATVIQLSDSRCGSVSVDSLYQLFFSTALLDRMKIWFIPPNLLSPLSSSISSSPFSSLLSPATYSNCEAFHCATPKSLDTQKRF